MEFREQRFRQCECGLTASTSLAESLESDAGSFGDTRRAEAALHGYTLDETFA